MIVLRKGQGELELLDGKLLPINFFEEEPAKILSSYKTLDKSKQKKYTSIADKYTNDEYSSLYQLYHDVIIVCSSRIEELKLGSKEYLDIDGFYTLASEIFIRESSKLRQDLLGFNNDLEEKDYLDIEGQITEEFGKITSCYRCKNDEVIVHHTKVLPPAATPAILPNNIHAGYNPSQQTSHQVLQPLFTSLIAKSAVDTRETFIPDPYELAKVIPVIRNVTHNSTTIAQLSPPPSKIPPPTSQPTEILTNFFHPNWYTIQVPSWLSYKSKVLRPLVASSLLKSQREDELRLITRNNNIVSSFAPVVDLKVSVMSTELKGNVWLNHIGYGKMQKIRKKYEAADADVYSNETEMDNSTDTDRGDRGKSVESNPDASDNSHFGEENNNGAGSDEYGEIDVKNLVNWDPDRISVFNSIRTDEEKIVKSGASFQKLINSNLLLLNRLRQERYLKGNSNHAIAPSKAEIRLYFKIQKLIQISLQRHNVTIDKLDFKPSARLPILMKEYSGTLPGMSSNKSSGYSSKSTRLPTIRGPYKKKNRQI